MMEKLMSSLELSNEKNEDNDFDDTGKGRFNMDPEYSNFVENQCDSCIYKDGVNCKFFKRNIFEVDQPLDECERFIPKIDNKA